MQRPWVKNVAAPFFKPYLWYQGISDEWQAMHYRHMFDDEQCVVPAKSHILLMHGRNDPVLDMSHVRDFAGFLRRRTEASVSEVGVWESSSSRLHPHSLTPN